MALLWFQTQASITETHEDISQILQVLLKSSPYHQDVINVEETLGRYQTHQHSFHQALECSWSVAETERHHHEFKQSFRSAEGSFLNRFLRHPHLPIARQQIEGGEVLHL